MLLRKRVRAPLVARSDGLDDRIGMALGGQNERDGRDARRAEDAKSQRGRGGCFRGGRVEDLQQRRFETFMSDKSAKVKTRDAMVMMRR